MAKNKKQTGFTIVELLIVIVVIGILAALVLNSFSDAQRQARNAQTISLAKAYHTAILAYAAEKGDYPPPSACLGTGYPDINNNGSGDCGGDTTSTWIEETTPFNTAIAPYIGNGTKTANPKVLRSSGGEWGIGAVYTYNIPTLLDGNPLNRWLVYYLEGTDAKCQLGPNAELTSWPNFTSGSADSGENWDNATRCWVPLPQTP